MSKKTTKATPKPTKAKKAKVSKEEKAILDTQIKKVFVCVTFPRTTNKEAIKTYLMTNGIKFIGVLHDKDIYLEDTIASDGSKHKKGEQKEPHFHFYCQDDTKNGKRLATWLDLFAEMFRKNKKDHVGIQIEKANHPNACCRYLLHLDDKQKHQYAREELFSSMEENLIEAYLSPNGDELDINTLMEVIEASKGNKLMIAKAIGLKHFNQYLRTIETLLKYSKEVEREHEAIEQAMNHRITKVLEEVCEAWAYGVKTHTTNRIIDVFQKYEVAYKSHLGLDDIGFVAKPTITPTPQDW